MRPYTLFASLLVLFAVEAHAATYTVTRFDDPQPFGCSASDCSLRWAVNSAALNGAAGVGPDTIVVPAGDYTLTLGSLPAVGGPGVHVRGAGSGQTRITTTSHFSLFRVKENGNLRITGMTVATGLDAQFTPYALRVDPDATLVAEDFVAETGLVDIDVRSTATLRQVALRRTFRNAGTTLVEDSTLAFIQHYGNGAGAGPLTLRRVLVDGSDYPHGFNGIASYGALTIEDSTVTGGDGILINSGSVVTLRRVHYIDNPGSMGTVSSNANVVIEDSLFENSTQRALYVGGGNWTVSGSTFRNNRSDQSVGGAIMARGGATLDIRNSTFAGNTFSTDAPAGARGAAIGFDGDAQVMLRHITFVPPIVMPVGTTGSAIGGTGNTARVEVFNSIVRGTCALEAGVLQGTPRGNIESPGNTCGLGAANNQVNVTNAALALGPLADHGGPTPTYSLNPGSVAIDNAHTLYYLPVDQRGYLRPAANTCDIGAYEVGGIDRIFKNGFDG